MKLWTRNFIFIFIANFFKANSFYILLAILPLYVTDYLKLGQSKVGIAMGVFSFTGVLVRPFAGAIIDSIGRLKVYRPAVVMFALCTGGYFFVTSFAALVLLRLIHGLTWGMIGTTGLTIAADIIPKERRAEGLGYYTLAMNVGMAIGPAIGIILIDFTTFKVVFFICLLLAIGTSIFGFSVKFKELPSKKISFAVKNLFEEKVLGLAFMHGTYGVAYGSIMSFAILYGKSMNISNSGFFFMIYAIVMSITRPLSGKHLDLNGPKYAMGFGFTMLIMSFSLLSIAKGPLLYFIVPALMGVGSGTVSPLLAGMSMNVANPDRRGAANATMFSAFDLGIGFGAIVLGAVAEKYSISFMYMISASLLTIPLFFFYFKEFKRYNDRVLQA